MMVSSKSFTDFCLTMLLERMDRNLLVHFLFREEQNDSYSELILSIDLAAAVVLWKIVLKDRFVNLEKWIKFATVFLFSLFFFFLISSNFVHPSHRSNTS